MGNPCSCCTLYSNLNSSKKLNAVGNTTNPKVIFVLPYPEFADDQGSLFCGDRGSFIRSAINKANVGNDYMITYMVKCFPAARGGSLPTGKIREPSQKEINNCIPHLIEELSRYPYAIIQTFGKLAFCNLTGDSVYLQKVGNEVNVKIGDLDRVIIPNFDPSYIQHKGNLYNDLIRTIKRAFFKLKKPDFDNIAVTLSYDEAIEQVDRAIELYKTGQIKHVYHDIENSISLLPWEGGEITVHAFCHDADDRAFSVPVHINDNILFETDYEIKPSGLSVSEQQRMKLHAKFGELLNTVPVVGHNYKYDARWLIWHNVVDINKLKVHADTMIMGFMVLNSDKSHGLGLEDLSVRLLFAEPWEYKIKEYLSNYKLNKDKHYGNIPTGLICPYACRDVYWVRKLYHYLSKVMPECSKGINKTVTGSIRAFLEPEVKGVKIDDSMFGFLRDNYSGIQKSILDEVYKLPLVNGMMQKYVKPLVEANEKKKKKLTIDEINKKAFNLGSPLKLREAMYDVYGMKSNNKYMTDKGSAQTGKDAIDYFLENDLKNPDTPKKVEASLFMNKVKVYKRIDKLYSSYINAIPEYVHGGLYRPDYKLSYVTTGRLSSIFHSIPNRCDIKRVFTSRWKDKGGLVMAGDYSQLELRIVAALSNETKFIEAFKAGVDPHKKTASIVYGKPVDKVTGVERQVGKVVNFAILYLMEANTLAGDLNKTEKEAQAILNRFYSGTDKLKRWQETQIKIGLSNGYIETVFGRRIPIKSYLSNHRRELAEAKRHSVNYPVQSFSAGTKVFLANGQTHTISQLTSFVNPFYLYSYDHTSSRLTVAKATKAFISHYTKEWLKVTLDNGEVIEVTPEHRFMLRDGSYLEACKLKVGQSLMPFNKRKTEKSWFKKGKADYYEIEQVNKTFDKWELVHRIVNEKYNVIPKDLMYLKGTSSLQTHHIDGNSLNNDPKNLEWLSISEHFTKHADIGHKNSLRSELYPKWTANQKKQASKMARDNLKRTGNVVGMDHDKYIELQKNRTKEHQEKINKAISDKYSTKEWSEKLSHKSKSYHKSVNFVIKYAINQITRFNDSCSPYHTPELWDIACYKLGVEDPSVRSTLRYYSYFSKIDGSWDAIANLDEFTMLEIPDNYMAWATMMKYMKQRKNSGKSKFAYYMATQALSGRYLGMQEFLEFKREKKLTMQFSDVEWGELQRDARLLTNNHKITKIESIAYDEPQPAYDIEVPAYHNFALDAGVVVHNSAASDVVLNASLNVFNAKQAASLKSVYFGCIHDSLEYDVYPGELIKMINLIIKNAEKRPVNEYHWLTCPLEMSFEFGSSWGGALECKIKSLDKDEVVLIGEGLRKDCKMFELVASRAYNVKVDVLEEHEIDESEYQPDILFRDSVRQVCQFSVSENKHLTLV